MVDVILFESLLRALKLNCRLIMVGDSDQLPSVGAGNLLKSLIESKCIPVIELKEIFRQAGMDVKVLPVSSAEYPAKAKRPTNSRLEKKKLEEHGFTRLPDWKDALGRYLKEIQ